MVKKDITFIVILLIVGIILLGAKFDVFNFIITGSETMSRSFTSQVDAGSTVSVIYSVSGASGTWGVSVIDNLASCRDKNGNLIPIDLSNPTGWRGTVTKKFVLISTEGTTVTQTFTMPNQEGVTCSFTGGNYQFGNKAIKNLPTQIISTKITIPLCSSGADEDSNGIISRSELGTSIDKWINNQIDRNKLGTAIMEWSSGSC